jgi:DNA-binding transcriptional LysR family regulator
MNFRQIEAFNAVMAAGATTRAAELLGVSQPAVSRLIKQLEQTTQLRLFDRVNGRLVPTHEGVLFHREVEHSFLALDRLKAAAADIRSYGTGNLRIAALPVLSFSLVPRVASEFLRKHTDNVAVTLETASSELIRHLVASDQFDVGFVAEEAELSGVVHELFAEVPAVCVIPKGHPLAKKSVIEAKDLQDEHFVALSRADRARRQVDALFDNLGIHRKIVVETHFAMSVCHFVQQGAGIGLVNPFSLDSIPPNSIVARPFVPRLVFRNLMIFPPHRPVSGLVQEFSQLAQKTSKPLMREILNRFGIK